MEHSIHHHQAPAPPPRLESYLTNGSFRQQFERDQNPNGENVLYPNMYNYDNSENNDNTNIHKGFQMYSPPNTPPEPAPPDHLLTPSSILRQLKEGASQSSLEEINSDVSGSKESLNTYDSGWLDDSFLIQKQQQTDNWHNRGPHRAFTTGRRPCSDVLTKKIRPKGASHTLKQPGKLNLKSFAIVNEAISKMNIGDGLDKEKRHKLNKKTQSLENAPLAAIENDSEDYDDVHYEQINEAYNEPIQPFPPNIDIQSKLKIRYRREKEQSKQVSDSESDSSSLERRKPGDLFSKVNRKPQVHKRMRKKRIAVPVQPPVISDHMYQKLRNDINEHDRQMYEEETSIITSSREANSPMFGVIPKLGSKDNEREKLLSSQKEKKTWFKDDSKQKKKTTKPVKPGNVKSATSFASFKQSENLIPVFLERCVQFIEKAGLDSEGIYRVPGNRAHVELLYHQFDSGEDTDIEKLDIPVNAVATALKDFFSKRLPPLFEPDLMAELEEIAGTRNSLSNAMNMEVKSDRSCRLISLRGLLNRLPPANFAILKFIFKHFVRVSENSKLNSMDSKNLAICWWPTLLPIEFTDMMRFESMRPYLEDICQTMIDQYPFLFCNQEAFVMV